MTRAACAKEKQMVLTVEQRVRAVIAEELGLRDEGAIASDASLDTDLGADSNDAISLTLALEDEFSIEIPDRDAEDLTTVRQIVDYVTRHAGTAT